MVALAWAVLSAFTLAASAGTTLWSGSFNSYSTASDFDLWSWSNEVGEYQWYIHGSQPTSHYLALDPSYKNPADTAETHGIKMTIDNTANWNGQTMERTELIPQTSSNLGTGNLFYHFSLKHSGTNPPNSAYEHQICFFESHFTELKYGVGTNTTNLVWMVTGVTQWSTTFVADTWYNFAYDIDNSVEKFTAGTVGLWASTGGAALTKVVQNVAASTSTNSEDWHLGVLRIITAADTEDWYFSGVYVESGPITTAIGSGGSTSSSSSSASSSTTTTSVRTTTTTTTPATTTTTTKTTSTTASTTSTASTATATHYGQCGGNKIRLASVLHDRYSLSLQELDTPAQLFVLARTPALLSRLLTTIR
ncbi:hypothetical protein C0991_002871 [Blastosporella zonata]|nr:hypothetical protein C0991_002871 [Blastosporella zonata]